MRSASRTARIQRCGAHEPDLDRQAVAGEPHNRDRWCRPLRARHGSHTHWPRFCSPPARHATCKLVGRQKTSRELRAKGPNHASRTTRSPTVTATKQEARPGSLPDAPHPAHDRNYVHIMCRGCRSVLRRSGPAVSVSTAARPDCRGSGTQRCAPCARTRRRRASSARRPRRGPWLPRPPD